MIDIWDITRPGDILESTRWPSTAADEQEDNLLFETDSLGLGLDEDSDSNSTTDSLPVAGPDTSPDSPPLPRPETQKHISL